MPPQWITVGTSVLGPLFSLVTAAIAYGAMQQRLKALEAEVARLQGKLSEIEVRTNAVERATDRILEKIEGLDRLMRHDLASVQSNLQLITNRLMPDLASQR